MDSIDRKICEILQSDGRVSSSEIAKTLGVSVSTANDRVRRLMTSGGVVSVRAILNPTSFDADFCCFVFVDMQHEGEAEAVRRLRQRPEVLELHHISGPHSYLAKIRCADARAVQVFLADVVKPLDAVRSTETMFSLCVEKETTELPIGRTDASS